jgi:carbonic anhydrase/acetyltransferase-like protein (isoleucine patch superfamily)
MIDERSKPLILGTVNIGANVSICWPVDINANHSRIDIGDDCDIASFVTLNCADSHMRCLGLSDEIERRPIVLKHNVFVGQGATTAGSSRSSGLRPRRSRCDVRSRTRRG